MDMHKLEALVGKTLNELGAASNAALVVLGDKLGLFRALAAGPAMTSAELARKTGTHERYVREWLSAQTASGFVDYDPAARRFSMSPEQAAVFADSQSPAYMAGGFYMIAAEFAGEPRLTEAFRTGAGIGWGEHCGCLFCGTEQFFRPGYRTHLVEEWLPALDGIHARLESGARVADIGCGHGASTFIMADAFPNSRFQGYDYHAGSITEAAAHVHDRKNIEFGVADAQGYAGDYDLITMFDALHDMGDPVGAAAHARRSLRTGGCLMVVEPLAGDRLEQNINPLGRAFYAASTQLCVPGSMSQKVGAALGAQAGEARLTEVLREAGFSQVRRAAATQVNMVLEARA